MNTSAPFYFYSICIADTLTAHYKYVYDGQGNVMRSIDVLSLKEYNYSYEDGRIIRATECDITLNSGEKVTSKNLVNSIIELIQNCKAILDKRAKNWLVNLIIGFAKRFL